MKKNQAISKVAMVMGCIGMGVAFIGFCGAIISTISTFTAMAGIGTATMGVAQFFMED